MNFLNKTLLFSVLLLLVNTFVFTVTVHTSFATEGINTEIVGDGRGGTAERTITPYQRFTYQPLVGIPGVDNAASDFNTYINQLYFLSISLAALLAVIKIIIGGVKWMLSDVVTTKADAKDEIKGAVLGLLLIISAVVILSTINPDLTNLRVLSGAPALTTTGGGPLAPAPINPNSAQGSAPITQTPNPDGTVSRSVSFESTLASAERQTTTINGITVELPVVDRLRLNQYASQQDELRMVTCSTNGRPGTIQPQGTPVRVLVRDGTTVRTGAPLQIYPSYSCAN